MNRSAEALIEQAEAYAHLFDRVSAGDRFDGACSEGPIRLSTDRELVQATASASRARRLLEVEQVRLAGEIAARSDRFSDTSLAARMGASGPADLVAQLMGVPREQAGAMVRLAAAIRPREAITGEPLPAERPHVAAAFSDGLLDRAVASAIVKAVVVSARGLSPAEADDLERQLIVRSQ